MAREGRQSRLRLVLCGICFRADCPLSKWVSDDGDLIDAIDELHSLWIEEQHGEMEKLAASKLTVIEKQELINNAIEEVKFENDDKDVEIVNLDALLDREVKAEEKPESEKAELITEKGTFLEDILKRYAEHESAEQRQNDKTKEQGH